MPPAVSLVKSSPDSLEDSHMTIDRSRSFVALLLGGALMSMGACNEVDLTELDPPAQATNQAPTPALQNTHQKLIGDFDFGARVQSTLEKNSFPLFGVFAPLGPSAPPTTGSFREPGQPASAHVKLAQGLSANYLTREAANHADMMSFWPSTQKPTHVFFCIESGREVIGKNADGTDKYNPSVQAIRIADGKVQTVLRGLDVCDGIRTSPWGTVLATEEADDGALYEIIDPLKVVNATVTARGAAAAPATITDARVVKRTALNTMAWEGFDILPSGVILGGDELRPGTANGDADGGAIFKFIPTTLRTGSGKITDLAQSPLVAGNNYAMQVSCINNRPQFGQGCEIGNAGWIPVGAATARRDADVQGATGYYRPEDGHLDPAYSDPAKPAAVRFCFTNTGNAGGKNYGEVMCLVDSAPETAIPAPTNVVVNRFLEGDPDLNQPDNLEFQPRTGNMYVIEDNNNGDIFACLKDGADRDIKTDGCVKIMSVVDSAAEPTGFTFTADGTVAIVSIQHSNDGKMPLVDGFPTDDILIITGFAAF
jgi:hypothetical protein